MVNGDVLTNDQFIPLVVSSVGLAKNIIDKEILNKIRYNGLRLSFWYEPISLRH